MKALTFRADCRTIATLVLAVVVVSASAAEIAAQAKAAPDLTGTWVLNTDLSGKPGQGAGGGDRDGGGRRGPEGGGGGMRRPGGGMGGRGGGFGGRGGSGDMPDREEMERMRAAMDAAVRAAKRLIIVKGETGLIVTDDEGVSTRLALDGRKETGAINGAPFESTTKWDDGKLRVEKKFKGGLKVVEIYSVSVEPRLLTISSRIEGGRRDGGRTLTRVYDAEAR